MILFDTHAAIWAGVNDPRLGEASRRLMERAAAEDAARISAITPWEIAMLVAKDRVALGKPAGDWVRAFLAQPGVEIVPLTPDIAVDAGMLPDSIHGDPADRIIIATARAMDCPVLTADGKMLRYGKAGFLGIVDARR
jgi:PIN domain nuclease of toxin-antitoxin system